MIPSFPNADAFNGNNSIQHDFGDFSSAGFIPQFPMDSLNMAASTMANESVGWPLNRTNDLLFMPNNTSNIQSLSASIPVTTAYYSQTMVNNDNNFPVVDNQQQQAHMVTLMMQQQVRQQQQQQQQQQLLLQQRQARQRTIPNERQYNSNTTNQAPHWLIKQQQAKMLQGKLKASSSPSSQVSSSLSMHNSPTLASPNVVTKHSMTQHETEALLTKRIEVILSINQEIIRLCLEHNNSNCEPDLLIYQARLQPNLTYLATMADISVANPEDHQKLPTPPDLSPLPPPQTITANRIHALLNSAQLLFAASEPNMSPYPQPMMFMHPQQPSQQQYKAYTFLHDFNELTPQRGNDNTVSNINDSYYYNQQQQMMIMDENTTTAIMYSNNNSVSH